MAQRERKHRCFFDIETLRVRAGKGLMTGSRKCRRMVRGDRLLCWQHQRIVQRMQTFPTPTIHLDDFARG